MMNEQNYNLNLYIQKDEIIKCIQKLKNNKSGGEDAIINEYIKATSNQIIAIYDHPTLRYKPSVENQVK
jgi:hypothetical protein